MLSSLLQLATKFLQIQWIETLCEIIQMPQVSETITHKVTVDVSHKFLPLSLCHDRVSYAS